jgi:hypothetical protein
MYFYYNLRFKPKLRETSIEIIVKTGIKLCNIQPYRFYSKTKSKSPNYQLH